MDSVGAFLYTVFWAPVAKLSLYDWLIILAPALIFDFFWGFFIRTVVLSASHIRQGWRRRRSEGRLRKIDAELAVTETRLDEARVRLAADYETGDRRQSQESLAVVRGLWKRAQELRSARIEMMTPAYRPMISLIIPVHNGAEVIEETLAAVKRLTYPEFETIVVNDGSTDDTAKLVARQKWVKLINRPVSTGRKTGAINFGLTYAKGQVIVVVDDDTRPEPGALDELMSPLVEARVAAVGGNIRVVGERRNLLIRLQEIEYMKTMELGRAWQSLAYGGVVVISGAFGAFNRDYLAQIGDYDIQTITEDLDVTWKLYKLRRVVRFARYAYAATDAPISWRQLERQRRRWDLGLLQTIVKHRHLLFNRRFKKIGLIMLPETVILELLLIAIKPFYLIVLLFSGIDAAQILLASAYFYVVLDAGSIIAAGLFSSNKWWAWRFYYAPLMVLYYIWLAAIRWSAIIAFLRRRETRW